jgi:hypothetical protein
MPRFCLTLVSLLAFLATANGRALAADDIKFEPLPAFDQPPPSGPARVSLAPPSFFDQPQRLPPVDQPLLASPFLEPGAAETLPKGELITLDKSKAKAEEAPVAVSLYDFLGYRYSTNSLDWIPGGGNDFGMFSIVGDPYIKSGINHDIAVGLAFHSLSGPVQTDMPSWVFDFALGYQYRQRWGPIAVDLSAAVDAASDFKGNARRGILFPSHAVGFLTIAPALDLVFGIDYLDRGDIKLLPVGGLIWVPNPNLRIEAVFPRPRVTVQVTEQHRIYVAGELGGGTWAIERTDFDLGDDLATYRDLRLAVGIEDIQKDGSRCAFEIAYLFNRRLEYTSGIGNMNLNDSVLLRLVTRY